MAFGVCGYCDSGCYVSGGSTFKQLVLLGLGMHKVIHLEELSKWGHICTTL